MTKDTNLITWSDLKSFASKLNSEIRNITEAYVVGTTPFASDWLGDTNGNVYIPKKNGMYIVRSTGDYFNHILMYNGTGYIAPVTSTEGAIVVAYVNADATVTAYGQDFLVANDGDTTPIPPDEGATYLVLGDGVNYKNSILKWNGTKYVIILSSGGVSPTYVGATDTTAGIVGLVPSASTKAVKKVLRGDGTWGDPETMIGASASSKGKKGIVPDPQSSDYNKALFGDGRYHTVFNSADASDIHVSTGDATWAGGTVEITNGVDTLTGVFDAEGNYTFTDCHLWGSLTVKGTSPTGIESYASLTVTYFGNYVVGLSSEFAKINLNAMDSAFYGLTIKATRDGEPLEDLQFDTNGKASLFATVLGKYEFTIVYDGKKRVKVANITALIQQNIDLDFKKYEVYAYKVDEGNSDPDTRVTPYTFADGNIYGCDNENYANAFMDFDADSFNYGDWENAFFLRGLKVAQLKRDGSIDYELDRNDYSKKKDGTPDPNYQSFDGDDNVMVGFPNMYFKRFKKGNVRYCVISDVRLDETFFNYAHHNVKGETLDYIYMAAYDGSVDSNGRVRSVSGQYPHGGWERQEEINGSKLNNLEDIDTTTSEGWSTWHLADWMMLQDLLVLIGMNTNSQAVYGQGNSNGYNNHPAGSNGYGQSKSGTCDTKGLFYGSSSNIVSCKVFGIENLWGSIWKAIQGLILSGSTVLSKMTYGQEDGTTVDGFNTNGSGYNTIHTGMANGSGMFITKLAYSENGEIPISFSGSDSTYECDCCWTNTPQTCFALVGCGSPDVSSGGYFTVNLNNPPSGRNWDFGSALTCKL